MSLHLAPVHVFLWKMICWLKKSFKPVLQDSSDRETGHQSFWEASLLSRPAATQRTWVQRLSPKNKRGLPYILFTAGYGNGGTAYLIHVTYYFIGYLTSRAWWPCSGLVLGATWHSSNPIFVCFFHCGTHYSLIISLIVSHYLPSPPPCIPATPGLGISLLEDIEIYGEIIEMLNTSLRDWEWNKHKLNKDKEGL
jgi:hypothetical protein